MTHRGTEGKEIEFKYRADDLSLATFREFCETKEPLKYLECSGWDYFYQNQKEDDSFCRFRFGPDLSQLTFKKKTTDSNNFVRTEHNLDLDRGVTEGQARALCKEFGYQYNASIYKNCFIYKYDWYTIVFYVCYDENLKELGRFLELEMKETPEWHSEAAAWNELVVLEKLCKPLGIVPQARIKRSLYEMFRK